MKSRFLIKNESGFTLIEAIASIFLISLIGMSVFLISSSSLMQYTSSSKRIASAKEQLFLEISIQHDLQKEKIQSLSPLQDGFAIQYANGLEVRYIQKDASIERVEGFRVNTLAKHVNMNPIQIEPLQIEWTDVFGRSRLWRPIY